MLDCWRLAGASAPLNFAFMFEGEEENGSLGFQESVAANLDWFADAALVIISNTVWVGENRPCLTYGMRGMVTASLVVSGFGTGATVRRGWRLGWTAAAMLCKDGCQVGTVWPHRADGGAAPASFHMQLATLLTDPSRSAPALL